MNAKTLADKLGKHPNTIYKDIKSGKIKATKVGKSYEVDDIVAHNMIVRHIYDKSSGVTDQVMNTLIEKLEEEKRRSFSEFLMHILPIAGEYMNVIDSLEDWELENMSDNPIVIDAEIKAIEKFERKMQQDWDDKPRNVRSMLETYEKTKKAIEVVKENKILAEYAENFRNQCLRYENVKKKLNKEDVTIKEMNENIEI